MTLKVCAHINAAGTDQIQILDLPHAGSVTLVKSPVPTNLNFPIYIMEIKGLISGLRQRFKETIQVDS